ncbi:MAG: hypothetical protein U0835_19510 [Isosphaeraceae bacterium]
MRSAWKPSAAAVQRSIRAASPSPAERAWLSTACRRACRIEEGTATVTGPGGFRAASRAICASVTNCRWISPSIVSTRSYAVSWRRSPTLCNRLGNPTPMLEMFAEASNSRAGAARSFGTRKETVRPSATTAARRSTSP